MAFHGSRGSSGGVRRGKSNNMSRGGGRGGFRGGRGKPIFDSVRIAQQKEKLDEDREDSVTQTLTDLEDVDEGDDDSSEEDDKGNLTAARSYAALMESFAVKPDAQAKRRKLNHDSAPEPDTTDEEIDLLNDTDIVDDLGEDSDVGIDGVLEDDDDEPQDDSDPFETNFAAPNADEVSKKVKDLLGSSLKNGKVLIPNVGKAVISIPGRNEKENALPSSPSGPDDLVLKQKLKANVTRIRPRFDSLEAPLASILFNHQDLLFCERDTNNAERLRLLVCLHSLNHVFKTRDHVIKDNARLAKEEFSDSLELRDQGFTRPKVLFILPTRESCNRVINTIISLWKPEQQENRKRFEESYVEKVEESSEDKAPDFQELFGGNDDDMFRMGMKFTRKTVKYFSQFYNSDIIFGSPLGLRMAVEGKDEKKGDYDFLSSIEVVVVDQADALLMQNFEHVEYIFEHLNLQPRESHGCDFSRVRSWYLDNQAKYFRQNIALSAFNTPELNTLFYNQSVNWRGKVKVSAPCTGAIQELGLKVKQTFSRLDCSSFTMDPDVRFTYFTTAIIPGLVRRTKDQPGTIIFIPSYLDFVRVRNYFATSPTTSSVSFGNVSEYTSAKEVARARSHFFSGRHSVLLYTERAHHFRRYRIRGVKRIIMYGLPDNPIFYKEIVGEYLGRSTRENILAPGEGTVRVLFSKWDVLKLERIAGTERVQKMISEKGDTFDFV